MNYIENILSTWEKRPQEGALKMIRKYGYPQEAIASRFIWYQNTPWKRTIVFRDTVLHNFPTPHVDFLTQTIDYRTPLPLYDEIAKFDGSVYLDRTSGEVSAKCHMEEANFLTLNLFHEIIIGKKSVDEARLFYSDTIEKFIKHNEKSPYLERFLFPKQFNTADPDISYF